MNISQREMMMIHHYLENPQLFIPILFHAHLPDFYPDGTKVTRGKMDENGNMQRRLVIPQDDDMEDMIIPLDAQEDDVMEHSCTLINSKMYFHSHSDDKTNYFKHHTVKNGLILVKQVVKEAVDKECRSYCLISKSAISMKYLRKSNPKVRECVGNHYYLSQFGIYRDNGDYYKTIEIVPFKGNSLFSYLEKNTNWHQKTDVLIVAILNAYLEQIANKHLVHTDINPGNICIIDNADDLQLTFIDFEESFIEDLQSSNGLGTPGYVAPEFFKKSAHCAQQLEIRAQGEAKWLHALKDDFRTRFTVASDIFALGRLLLDDIEVDENSIHFDLIVSMCATRPESRPTPQIIKDTLERHAVSLQLSSS